jgi:hypothetical protein
MRITSAGNVLIGKTSSTGGVLQVSNGTNMFNVDYDANGPYITAVNNANTVYKRLTIDASEILFDISAAEKMRITSGGNVGINNTTPSTYLDVSNNGTNNNAYITTRNTGINGYRSGAIFNTSTSNIALGFSALGGSSRLGQVDSSNYNIAIGASSLSLLWEFSNNNVAIGDDSLGQLGNIGIGGSGSTGNNNNTCIGANSGNGITGGANNTIIGPTGGTGGMTGTIVLSNGNNTTEIVINNSNLQSGSYTSNRRIPIKIGGATYYLMLST